MHGLDHITWIHIGGLRICHPLRCKSIVGYSMIFFLKKIILEKTANWCLAKDTKIEIEMLLVSLLSLPALFLVEFALWLLAIALSFVITSSSWKSQKKARLLREGFSLTFAGIALLVLGKVYNILQLSCPFHRNTNAWPRVHWCFFFFKSLSPSGWLICCEQDDSNDPLHDWSIKFQKLRIQYTSLPLSLSLKMEIAHFKGDTWDAL